MLVFLQNTTHIPSLKAFIIINMDVNSLKYFLMKLINWERKGNMNLTYLLNFVSRHPEVVKPRIFFCDQHSGSMHGGFGVIYWMHEEFLVQHESNHLVG